MSEKYFLIKLLVLYSQNILIKQWLLQNELFVGIWEELRIVELGYTRLTATVSFTMQKPGVKLIDSKSKRISLTWDSTFEILRSENNSAKNTFIVPSLKEINKISFEGYEQQLISKLTLVNIKLAIQHLETIFYTLTSLEYSKCGQ